MRADNIGIHETHHAGRHPPPLPDAAVRPPPAHFTVPRLRASPLEKAAYSPPPVIGGHASRATSSKLKTNSQRQSVRRVLAAAMLSSARVGYRLVGSPKTYPFDLFRTDLDVTECYTKSKKTALVASPETGGRALDEPKVKNETNPIRPFVFNKRPKRKPNSTTTENKRPTPIGLASFRRGHASSVRTAIPARRISENVPD